MRRYGPPPIKGVAYRERAGVYCVVLLGCDALVVDWQGDIVLPGGGIEPGESPLQALHREVYEETGWSVAVERRLGLFQRYTWMEPDGYWGRKVQHIYLCRPIRELGPPIEPDHTPMFKNAALAADMLEAEGERAMMAAALRDKDRSAYALSN